MQSFGFKVVPAEGDSVGVPVSVAGQTMVDIQTLITDIGSMMVRQELRIQNSIPSNLLSKFDLRIGGPSANGLGADTRKGSEQLLEDVLGLLGRTLDFLGKGVVGEWMTDNFQNPVSRRIIARDLLKLHTDLRGYVLEYGIEGNMRRFSKLDVDRISSYAEEGSMGIDGMSIGAIARDPVRRNKWNLINNDKAIPLSFTNNIDQKAIPEFASMGATLVHGTIMRNENLDISEIRGADSCFQLSEMKFHRMISADSDLVLLNPITAKVSYDQAKGLWNLKEDNLGIDESKTSWDECVTAFHEYFMFLWDTYADNDKEFAGEEKEVREFLLSLVPIV